MTSAPASAHTCPPQPLRWPGRTLSIEKTLCSSIASSAFFYLSIYLSTRITLSALACAGSVFRKRTAHGMLARPMRQENQLDKTRFIPLALLHHGGDADALRREAARNQRQHARFILRPHADESPMPSFAGAGPALRSPRAVRAAWPSPPQIKSDTSALAVGRIRPRRARRTSSRRRHAP